VCWPELTEWYKNDMLLLKCKYLYNETKVGSTNSSFMQEKCVYRTVRTFVQIDEKNPSHRRWTALTWLLMDALAIKLTDYWKGRSGFFPTECRNATRYRAKYLTVDRNSYKHATARCQHPSSISTDNETVRPANKYTNTRACTCL
jgi:hypothetical protein